MKLVEEGTDSTPSKLWPNAPQLLEAASEGGGIPNKENNNTTRDTSNFLFSLAGGMAIVPLWIRPKFAQ
jgi:hypothetical protein